MAKDDELIGEITSRFEDAFEAMSDEYDEMISDLEFVGNADQWPAALRKEREADGRPCLVIDKLSNFGDQIIGDIRQNEPSIKVKPVDSDADPDVAEIFTGLIRNIEVQSRAEIAYDTAAESSVWCGKGCFRVVTEYDDDDTFEQCIKIKRMKNPLTVFWDPSAQEWDKSDARYCFVTERIDREEYDRLYPDAAIMDHPGGKDMNAYWGSDKSVRVAEYFVKEETNKKLYLMRDPITGEETTDNEKIEGWEVVQSRKVTSHKIMWYKTNGREILEREEWAGRYIPIIEVWGKEVNVEGRTVYRGIVRKAKDPQKLYNFSRSHGAEMTALAPKTPYLVTANMIKNYQRFWDTSHKKSYPYLPYETDPSAPGVMPKRADPIVANSAIMTEIQIADQELHDTTGLQQASLGKQSNEKSGKAILARQREGDVANFTYYDNLGRAIAYCGKVLVDLIPKIYDTARVLRIINPDESDDFVPVNEPVQVQQDDGSTIERIFDLSVGKYDVVVTVGPSYSTQRDEAAENMLNFVAAVPDAGPLIADLIAKNLDWPGADEFEERLKMLLPPELRQLEEGGNGGQPQQPQQPQVDPVMEFKRIQEQAKVEGVLLDNQIKEEKLRVAKMEPRDAPKGK